MYWTEHSYRHVKLPHSLSMASQMENHMGDPQVRFGAFQTGGGYPQSSSISNDGMFPHQKPSSELGAHDFRGHLPVEMAKEIVMTKKIPIRFLLKSKSMKTLEVCWSGSREIPCPPCHMKNRRYCHVINVLLSSHENPIRSPWIIPWNTTESPLIPH